MDHGGVSSNSPSRPSLMPATVSRRLEFAQKDTAGNAPAHERLTRHSTFAAMPSETIVASRWWMHRTPLQNCRLGRTWGGSVAPGSETAPYKRRAVTRFGPGGRLPFEASRGARSRPCRIAPWICRALVAATPKSAIFRGSGTPHDNNPTRRRRRRLPPPCRCGRCRPPSSARTEPHRTVHWPFRRVDGTSGAVRERRR